MDLVICVEMVKFVAVLN